MDGFAGDAAFAAPLAIPVRDSRYTGGKEVPNYATIFDDAVATAQSILPGLGTADEGEGAYYDGEEDEEDGLEGVNIALGRKRRRGVGTAADAGAEEGDDDVAMSAAEQHQVVERRERNREHARRSRVRKRMLLDLLSDRLTLLREQNKRLRQVVSERIPHLATGILAACTTEESLLLLDDEVSEARAEVAAEVSADKDQDNLPDGAAAMAVPTAMPGPDAAGAGADAGDDSKSSTTERKKNRYQRILAFQQEHGMAVSSASGVANGGDISDSELLKKNARILMEPDFRLLNALSNAQQNFVLTDPSLTDNPIVYCSEGFCKLTGYKRSEVIGRNCRFLQGPGTDLRAVDIIRQGIAEGKDVSVCLLNYKSNRTHFWNQFFVAALKDSDGAVVNYVGVQCEVDSPKVQQIKDRVKRMQIPADYA